MGIKLISIFIIGSMAIIYGLIYERDYKLEKFYENKTKKYERAYHSISTSYENLANFLYKSITNDEELMNMYEKSLNVNKFERDMIRQNMLFLLDVKIPNLKLHDIVQLQFHLENNENFLRYYNSAKFGDDLTYKRPTIAYVNKYHKPISGIEQGKIYNANRYVYPLKSKSTNQHIGSLGISFSISSILSKMMSEYGGKSYFMINKNLIDEKVFISQKARYTPSNIDGYYCDKEILKALEKFDLDKMRLSKPSKKLLLKIQNIIKSAEVSTVYNEKTGTTVTIIPIKNPVTLKQIAFIKIGQKAPFVRNKIINTYILIGLSILLLFIVLLFMYKQSESKRKINKEKELVQNIINSIPNITFVTNFKTIEYSNRAFLEFFNLPSIQKFNELHPDMLDIFLPWDDYLHKGKLSTKEDFTELVINTDNLNRKVMMFDKTFSLAAFSISISKVNYNSQNSYLLTLSNITQQEIEKKEIEHQAYYDGLTNVFNRNKFNELFEIELRKAKRYKIPSCVAIIDIDHFKKFNDTYGHLIGDEVLISLANEVNNHVRETDTFARWGGEEFTILFSNTTIDIANSVSQKVRKRIESLEHKVAGNITASFGLTSYKDDDTIETMFKRCDDALYEAKENGRNRVEIS